MLRYSQMRLLALAFALVVGFSSEAIAREYGDITLDATQESMAKAGVNTVVFPHWFHRIRFKCKVCHENIFIMKKGANNISMRRIMEGEACGVCHNGQIAWEPLACERCHNGEPAQAAVQPMAGGTNK